MLFDMGGVLVELGPLDELLGVAMPAEAFWPRWLASDAVRRYERGLCTDVEFAAGLAADFELPLSTDELTDRFRRFPRGLYHGAAELVRGLVDGVVSGVLSNTNQLHWERQVDAAILQGLFDHEFLSYRLGLVKPDAAIFEQVVAELSVAPSQVLFLDDNLLNVEGARQVGLDAHHTRGVAEARQVLADRNLLTL